MFKKYKKFILLTIISLLGVALFFFNFQKAPPCLNADEVGFAYDAYSILKTGADQYGKILPLRFKSFGDYKLPLSTYVSVPFIKLFGLNDTAILLVNLPFLILFPYVIFLFVKEFFDDDLVAYLAAFLINFAPGLQLLGRQAHEGYMTAFFLTVASLFFMKLIKKGSFKNYFFFLFFLLISLFGYHSTRLWAGFFVVSTIFFIYKKKVSKYALVALIAVISIFAITDILNFPTRVSSLLFISSKGFVDQTNEFQWEGGPRIIYNKLTVGAKDLTYEYIKYFSPQFFVTTGDENARFGYPGMSPITPVEYVFIFIGLYYLFKNKEKWRYLLVSFFLFSPISASLSWAGESVTRSVFIFIPALIISSYGIINLTKNKKLLFGFIAIVYIVFLFYAWDLYLNHYSKRPYVVRSWQCGYKELLDYVKVNYNKYDKFYVTRRNGEPYIFFLYYLKYPPQKYQKQAHLSAPDEFGFGQVDKFDKFVFDLPLVGTKNSVIIGFPDEFDPGERKYLKQIKIFGTETIFLIKEVK